MARQEILDRIQKYVHPFRVTKGKGFQLKDFDPATPAASSWTKARRPGSSKHLCRFREAAHGSLRSANGSR